MAASRDLIRCARASREYIRRTLSDQELMSESRLPTNIGYKDKMAPTKQNCSSSCTNCHNGVSKRSFTTVNIRHSFFLSVLILITSITQLTLLHLLWICANSQYNTWKNVLVYWCAHSSKTVSSSTHEREQTGESHEYPFDEPIPVSQE